jgi:uncharacterized lipoprotein YmbA
MAFADRTRHYRLVYSLVMMVMPPLFMSGCIHKESKPIHFYRLTAETGINTNQSALNQDKTENPMIGLGPIHIPEYLDRPQMVIAVTDHQYRLSEDHRWAESLDKNISLALFKALPNQLGTERIVRYPWPQRLAIDYQIGIDILEFNVDANSQSRLTAQWFIKRKDQTTIDKRFDCRIPSSNTNYDVMVEAQSQCLSKLGREIANTFRQNQ